MRIYLSIPFGSYLSYFTSSKINYIEYQYITYHMVQISNIISILKTWNQESLRAFHAI